jgi:diguanylate cyclase (GGDEF)-like protein/PAS domain S-box-containing protein
LQLQSEKSPVRVQKISHLGSWDWEIKTGTLFWSDGVFRAFGRTPRDFSPTYAHFISLIHPDDLKRVLQASSTALVGEGVYDVKYRITRPNGEIRHLHDQAELLRDAQGDPWRMVGISQDVTESEQIKYHLERTVSQLSATLEATIDGILVVNSSGEIENFNRCFVEMWNVPQTLIEHVDHCRLLSFMMEQVMDSLTVFEALGTVRNPRRQEFKDFIELKDGRVFEYHSNPQVIENEMIGRVCSFRDVTESKTYAAKLEYFATHDPLTGLPNRNLLCERVDNMVVQSLRSGLPFSLLYLDLDRFKHINESFGHNFGDSLLRAVAQRIKESLRSGDSLTRMGGDEFIVLLTEIVNPENSALVARRVIDSLFQPFLVNGQEIFTSSSIGISLFPQDGSNTETLLKHADMAMDQAKRQGGNRFAFYSPDMNAQMSENMELESKLRRALEREELLLHYQPQVNMRDGRIIGAEALLRWRHPELGLLFPGSFISLAEQLGLIMPMGEWAIQMACFQNRAWQAQGLPQIRVAVNLSAGQFARNELPAKVERVLQEAGLDANFLELEITESAMMENTEEAIRTMQELKALGVQLAIDDFGTGYSSLSYLKRFPVDQIKIDRSFVEGIPGHPDSDAIVRTVIYLAHNLRFRVIAEGVETGDQAAFLLEHGCEHGQGYYFGRPMPAGEFEALLKRHTVREHTEQSEPPCRYG